MSIANANQLVGKTLGEYLIQRQLGQGPTSTVYMAQQLSQGRIVMITTFNFPEDFSAQARDQFTARVVQEGASLVRLTHPHILPIYDFSEHSGYLYLVTPFMKGASLGQVLKQQIRFTPKQTLDALKQLAAGLDYAHGNGVVHGRLDLSNALMSDETTIQIAGFGLKTLLEMRRNTQSKHPQAHLFSTNGAFLGNPECFSPEYVLGMPADARSDIYALGVMLFKLLSGLSPFGGENPLEIALKRTQQPVPSIHEVCPAVPEGFNVVISKALERDPRQRYQRAGDLAAAFERALHILALAERGHPSNNQQLLPQDPQMTLPPTVNWFEEADTPSNSWQLSPPIITGHVPAATSSAAPEKTALERNGSWQTQDAAPSLAGGKPDSIAGVDPFTWWSATSTKTRTPQAGTLTRRPAVRTASSNPQAHRQPAQMSRRKLVTLIAAGTAAAGVGIVSISFAHFAQSLQQAQTPIANRPASTAPTSKKGETPTTGSPQKTQIASHTGTVIGYNNQAVNSSKLFTNPADGQESLLIRLPNGNFVACERACTHRGIAVNYDPRSQQLICPAHGAVFDPAHRFNHVSGPGNGPLATVSIRTNGDGTVTTG